MKNKSFHYFHHLVSVFLVFAAFSAMAAKTCYWTGGGSDGKWSNPDNWKDGSIPGRYTNIVSGVATLVGSTGDTAIFGAVEANAQTVIDLLEQHSIFSVQITEGAPAYCFGTTKETQSQSLSFENNGNFTVQSGVSEPQTIYQVGMAGNKGNFNLWNNSTSKLTYGNVYRARGTSSYSNNMYLRGTGPIEFNGQVTYDQIVSLVLLGTGKYTWSNTGAVASGARYDIIQFGDSASSDVDLTINSPLYGIGGSACWTTQFSFNGKSRIHGPSLLAILYPWNAPGVSTPQVLTLKSGSKVTIDSGITATSSMASKDLIFNEYGEVYLNSTNLMTGVLRLMDSVTCGAKMIGNKGCSALETSIPRGNYIVYEGYWSGSWNNSTGKKYWTAITPNTSRPRTSKFKYTGEVAAATDRDIMVSNLVAAASNDIYKVKGGPLSTNTFANAGGATFTLNSAIYLPAEYDVLTPTAPGVTWKRYYAQEAAFRLQAETADLDFNGSFPQSDKTWHLFFAGPKTVTVISNEHANVKGNLRFESGTAVMASPSVFPNAKAWQFAGGALKFTNTVDALSFAPTFASGASTICVPAGQNLTVTGFSGTALPSGASVNFEIASGATVTLPDATVSTLLPNAVTVNGYPSKVLSDGSLISVANFWKSAVNGDWSDSDKWDPLVPGEKEDAYITASGESYTVTLADNDAKNFRVIEIGNDTADMTATLAVTAKALALTNATVLVKDGGVIGTAADDASLVFRGDSTSVTITNGGVWRSTSGTNLWDATNSRLKLLGGTIEMSGTACFQITNYQGTVDKTLSLRRGNLILKGDAVWDNVRTKEAPKTIFAPGEGEEMRVTMAERFRVRCRLDHCQFMFGYYCKGRAYLDFELEGSRDLSTGYTSPDNSRISAWRFGTMRGYGELNLKSGKMTYSNSGFEVGTCAEASDPTGADSDYSPTGVVNQTGGTLSGGSIQAAYSSMIHGFEIGSAPYVYKNKNGRFRGTYNFSGGTIWLDGGLFLIGAGVRGIGEFVQTGGYGRYSGECSHYATKGGVSGTDNYKHPMLIGYLGGTGRYLMGGGTMEVSHGCYVGGCHTNSVGLWGKTYHNDPSGVPNLDGAYGRGYGLLSVTGGVFAATEDLVVGSDGTGVVHVAGGKLTCRNLILSNDCASTLSYTLSADAAAPWTNTASQAFVIADGAKLVIDVRSAKRIASSKVRLLTSASVEGSFAAENIEFLTEGAPAGVVHRTQEAELFYNPAGYDPGLMLKFGKPGTVILLR